MIGDFINDDQAAPLRTDADGLVVVTLASNGLNVIQASHAEACQGRMHDRARRPFDDSLLYRAAATGVMAELSRAG